MAAWEYKTIRAEVWRELTPEAFFTDRRAAETEVQQEWLDKLIILGADNWELVSEQVQTEVTPPNTRWLLVRHVGTLRRLRSADR
jgi:hypothetical protein